ncbi:MAG: hypothetical protein ACI9UQ_002063, partial [Candidatus Krumholzibacteriia bacterium]
MVKSYLAGGGCVAFVGGRHMGGAIGRAYLERILAVQ